MPVVFTGPYIPSEDGKESVEDLAVFSEPTAVMSARSSVDGPRMSLSRKLLGKIARHSQVYTTLGDPSVLCVVLH